MGSPTTMYREVLVEFMVFASKKKDSGIVFTSRNVNDARKILDNSPLSLLEKAAGESFKDRPARRAYIAGQVVMLFIKDLSNDELNAFGASLQRYEKLFDCAESITEQ